MTLEVTIWSNKLSLSKSKEGEEYSEIVERWKRAKKLYEIYPRLLEEMEQEFKTGKYSKEYEKSIREIIRSKEKSLELKRRKR